MEDICHNCKKRPINVIRSICKCTICLDSAKRGTRKYYRENKQNVLEYQKEYCQRNKQKIYTTSKKWVVEHRDKILEYKHSFYQRHKDTEREKRKLHYQKNKEKITVNQRNYYRENKEIRAATKHRSFIKHRDKAYEDTRNYRAKKLSSIGNFSSLEFRGLLEKYKHKCLWCGISNRIEADHVILLSQGGTNYISNIQPLCRSCNAKKHTKTIDFRPFGSMILDWT